GAIASHGYMTGIFHPYKKRRFLKAFRIMRTLAEAHSIMFEQLKLLEGDIHVGASYNWQHWEGLHVLRKRFEDRLSTSVIEQGGGYSDFLGLQYYARVKNRISQRERKERDWNDHPDFGDIYPPGILDV